VLGEALRYVPDEAEIATLTDFDRFRDRLDVPDMTSEYLMTDRSRFWEQAPSAGVLLHEGRLRDQNSRLELDHGFTQDDVDWELGFTGAASAGFVLGFRPDLDMSRVQDAVDDAVEPLAGATVLADEHVLVSGDVPGTLEASWADEPWAAAVSAQPADAYYLRGGERACVPLADTLGTDATVEDQEAVLAKQDIRGISDFTAFAMAFNDARTAFALLSYDAPPEQTEVDLRARLDEAWPQTSEDSVVWADAFETKDALPVDDAGDAVVPVTLTNPRAARAVLFDDALPLAVCGDVRLLPEPTGL
jgi:hypothetical protein